MSLFIGYITALFFHQTSTFYLYNHYLQLIDLIDFMVVCAYNGTIGRGSYYEIRQALEWKIAVYEFYPVDIGSKLRKVVSVDLLPVNKISS